MCGICGIAGESARAAEPVIDRMTAALRHRGPDEEGRLLAPGVALGTRRLSIIDLPGGHQPMTNEDGRVVVAFNGEISNFQELRRELEGLGHTFRTRSDTETIVHGYESWGERCVERLDGMFALAVVEFADAGRGRPLRLLLARDRFGIKPLYYAQAGGRMIFASEVRALLASGRIAGQAEPEAVAAYLLFGSVLETQTLVKGVRSLGPGHRLTVRLDPGEERAEASEPAAYWNLAEAAQRRREEESGATQEDAAAGTRQRIESAVRSHLVSDVPLGVFLSGGMDSTALAALSSRQNAGVHTFTLIFEEREYNEGDVARRTALRLGTTHQETLLSGAEALAQHEAAVAALDQPSMDGINSYFISRAARQSGLKVALTGLGGDELFGGYPTFRSVPRLWRLAKGAPGVARPAAWLTERGAEAMARPDSGGKLASLMRDPRTLPDPYFFARLLFVPERVRALMPAARAFGGWGWMEAAAREAAPFDDFSRVTQLEMRTYMANTLLRDTDAMSMAHSLEVRVPLLDRELAEYVAGLPQRRKRFGRGQKPLLAKALGDVYPAGFAAQPKRTFTLPWEHWLRGPLRNEMEAELAKPAAPLEPYLDGAAVRGVWREFLDGRTSWSRPWSLFVLNRWARRYLDAPAASPSEEPAAAGRRAEGRS